MADDSQVEDEALNDLTNNEILDKYRLACETANKAISFSLSKLVPGTKIAELCKEIDNFINDTVKGLCKKAKEKGVAFPTSISPNHIAGHFSPLLTDPAVLNEGDLIKIDLGVHIDGYIGVAAQSTICTSNPEEAISGRKADVICAAHFAAEAALRLLKPGNTNTQVTEVIDQVAKAFNCNVVEGVLSHQTKRFVIDGNNAIIGKVLPDQRVEEFTIEEGQVFALDIVISTGEGKLRPGDFRSTIFKKNVDSTYRPKLESSRHLLKDINSKYPALPFNLRTVSEDKYALLGIQELIKHDIVQPFPVLVEKGGEFVAQFKFTVQILSSITKKIAQFTLPFVNSSLSITDPKINQLLQTGLKRSAPGKKKKKKKKATVTSAEAAAPVPMESE